MSVHSLSLFFTLGSVLLAGCSPVTSAEYVPSLPEQEVRFGRLLAESADLTHDELIAQFSQREYLDGLTFDPANIPFYEETVKQLKLTDAEQQMLRSQGFVSIDHKQHYSFGSLYYAIYTRDLPVLVTTDSILHALHRTFDDLLMEIEQTYLTSVLQDVLQRCQSELQKQRDALSSLSENCEDVDLYLAVAQNLLLGAGAPHVEKPHRIIDGWNGELLVGADGQNEQVLEILLHIQSLKMQFPGDTELTHIYGGRRAIDYSQFKPRGHYTKTPWLARYFRTMMWLGRADTAWSVLPPDPEAGILDDSQRGLRNAALLTLLLKQSGTLSQFAEISGLIDVLAGKSDNLTVPQLADLLEQQKLRSPSSLVSSRSIADLQDRLRDTEAGGQQIRSQVILSDPDDLYQPPSPSIFQLFGQRGTVDSFVLSKVVFDSIIFEGKKVKRMMPTATDVMFALGNDSALPLLADGLEEYPYAGNLKACRDFVDQYAPTFWEENLYNTWLEAIRTAGADLTQRQHAPESMRSEKWQRKQLQTQLASWAELRHDMVLYAKQPYTSEAKCEYPMGYVEPYPELYACLRKLVEDLAGRLENLRFANTGKHYARHHQREVDFLKRMATTLARLEDLAKKELAAEPFTEEDQNWLKATIDVRRRGSGGPQYTGWYCDLFYKGGLRASDWAPTVVDVHTDPNTQEVLEQGVGSCNFLVIAIDNEDDRAIYVGPAYSYYEFTHPASDRLTDEAWTKMLDGDDVPARPTWTAAFQPEALQRDVGK
ncbi:MAG: DUF3160 domain-containing protein [Planctomycetes bacterium]|nr:DUF3160 domain-containing protein [Planctomycetota bacterium]